MNKLAAVCVLFLLIGCFPLPIGYYVFLRIVISFACIVLIINDKDKGFNWSNILYGVVAVLFNPFFPIYLHDKTIWVVLDILAAILFGVQFYKLTKSKK